MKKRQLIVTLEEFFFNRSIHFLMFFESIVTYWAWINSSYFNFWQGLPKSIVYRKNYKLSFYLSWHSNPFFVIALFEGLCVINILFFFGLCICIVEVASSQVEEFMVTYWENRAAIFTHLLELSAIVEWKKAFFSRTTWGTFFLKVFTPSRNLLDIFAEKSTNWCLWMFYTLNMNVQEM